MADVDWPSIDDTTKRQRIADVYQSALGRAPSDADYLNWIGNADYKSGIESSPEAQAHASGQSYSKTYNPAAGWDFGKLNSGYSNTKYDFGRAVQDFGFTSRDQLANLINYYNTRYGGHASIVPGQDDMVDFGESYGPVDVWNGNGYAQWLVPSSSASSGATTPASTAGSTPGSTASTTPPPTTNPDPYQTQPFVAGNRYAWQQPIQTRAGTVVDPKTLKAYDTVAQAIWTYYGRQATPDEIWNQYLNWDRAPDDNFLQQIVANIQAQPEAQAYQAKLAAGAAPATPAPAPTAAPSGGSSGNTDTGVGYDNNPATELLLNQALSRLQQLNQPVNDPMSSLYQLISLLQIGDLSNAPYTQGEDAALVAQYMNPLTQARDAALDQQQENLARYGYLPSSGLAIDQQGQIQNQYQQAVGAASNDLAVKAVDERQARNQRQLEILANLVTNAYNTRQEDSANADKALQVAGIPFQIDQETLNALLNASGDGGSTASNLIQLLNTINSQNLQRQQLNDQNSQANTAAWMQALGYLSEIFG